MWIRYGNTLVNLDKTNAIYLEPSDCLDCDDSFDVVAQEAGTDTVTVLDSATGEGATEIVDRIFAAIQSGESAAVDQDE